MSTYTYIYIHIVEINGWKRRKAWNSERRQAASFTSVRRFGSRGNPVKEAIRGDRCRLGISIGGDRLCSVRGEEWLATFEAEIKRVRSGNRFILYASSI